MRGNLERVKAVDRYTARLHLTMADANLPAAFGPLEGDLQLLPKHYLETVGAQSFEAKPLARGPLASPRRTPGSRLFLDSGVRRHDV